MERWTDQPNLLKSSCAEELFFGRVGEHLVQITRLSGHSTNGIEYALTIGDLFGSQTVTPYYSSLETLLKELSKSDVIKEVPRTRSMVEKGEWDRW